MRSPDEPEDGHVGVLMVGVLFRSGIVSMEERTPIKKTYTYSLDVAGHPARVFP
jgi:hypothetical protein